MRANRSESERIRGDVRAKAAPLNQLQSLLRRVWGGRPVVSRRQAATRDYTDKGSEASGRPPRHKAIDGGALEPAISTQAFELVPLRVPIHPPTSR